MLIAHDSKSTDQQKHKVAQFTAGVIMDAKLAVIVQTVHSNRPNVKYRAVCDINAQQFWHCFRVSVLTNIHKFIQIFDQADY